MEEQQQEVSSLTHGWLVCCCVAVTFQLFRLSIDTIQTASQKTSDDYTEEYHGGTKQQQSAPILLPPKATTSTPTKRSKTTTNESQSINKQKTSYGATAMNQNTEVESLIPRAIRASSSLYYSSPTTNELVQLIPVRNKASNWSFRVQFLLLIMLMAQAIMDMSHILPPSVVWVAVVVLALNLVLTVRDLSRRRFGMVARLLYMVAVWTTWIPVATHYFHHRNDTSTGDELVMNALGLFVMLAVTEVCFVEWHHPARSDDMSGSSRMVNAYRKARLSRAAMLTLLKPYFWPDATADSASMNRLRAILTWVCVSLSKGCNLSAPICLGKAATALAHEAYSTCIWYSVAYATIQFVGSTLKECQSLVYLKVAQAAFVQLSETTFVHLHSLSLDWHLRKKLGEVIRSMDRGIAACDTLMKYLFLWMIPASLECIIVCIIFATYFQYTPLAVSVFYFVWMYIVWTILVTLWRKKFRKAVVKSDNEWHDRCTDSLINFETVKYFTAEEYERQRFGRSVQKYQKGNVQVQASLSFLNISQKILLQICLATALALSALGIQKRVACCIDHGCDSGVSDCCRAIDNATCPGMEVGDFVAVLTYTIQLFQPLNFLGSVYNSIVMAMIDLTNLSELLAEDPDVVDEGDALTMPTHNKEDKDIAIEFDNVKFHYPTQSSTKGLKGVSFKCKRGTTTAIVGKTGAGKTTISRLFFRFYDVLGGAVKVNGVDVRMVTQKSLRGSIGVVPQAASMFNESIRANLLYGKRGASQEQLNQAARDAQLLDFIESLDDGWETVVGDRGLKLSGGEKQRAAIARCLLKDPAFVLLDEATSALDSLTENSVQLALDRLGDQRTVLVIAHRLGTIRNADNIIVLNDGMVAEQGTHDELMKKDGSYAEMWNMQLHSTAGSRDSLMTDDSAGE